MLNKLNLKIKLMLIITMIMFAVGFSINIDAKTTTVNQYKFHTNKKVKEQATIVKNEKKKVIKKSIINYNKNGVRTTSTSYIYNNEGKLLLKTNYKKIKNKIVKQNRTYYYNTHAKGKKPLKNAYQVTYYKNNGKVKKIDYKTKKAKQNAIVEMAKKQKGKPYIAGSAGPKGFDCSGLTSYVYKKALNKNIGRATYNQKNKGKRINTISTKSLQPGDILLWGSRYAPYHAGIYLGNGKYIHSSTPRTGVEIKNLGTFKPSFAQRVI